MKIKRFEQINEGIKDILKPKSQNQIIKSLKDQCLEDINYIQQHLDNIKNNVNNLDESNKSKLDDFIKNVVELEVLYLISEGKRTNYDYNISYYRRLTYLRNNMGLKDFNIEEDEEEGEEEEEI